MKVLSYGIGLVTVAFFIHLIVWKIHLPRNHTKALLLIFFITLICGTLAFVRLAINEYLQLCIFFISFTLAYIATYSAIQVDSPSLVMIMTIAKEGHAGVDKNTFEREMNNDILITPRLNDLLAAGAVDLDKGVYKLRPKGKAMAWVFITYRKLLKKAYKGG